VPEKDDIKTRLLRSDAVTSLQAEQEVAEAFRRQPLWWVEHGTFYRDAPALRLGTRSGERTQYEWCGHRVQQIASACADAGISRETTRGVWEWFKRVAYSEPDGGSLVGPYLAEPPKTSVHATAFRETNVGAEKDLDNSVLWKSIQGLESILESERRRFIEGLQSDLKVTIEVAELDGRDVKQAIQDELGRRVKHVTLFHPIVVLDAHLWVGNASDLKEVDRVRLVVNTTDVLSRRWFDVVTRQGFSKWLDELAGHYGELLEHPKEHVWRQNVPNLELAFAYIFDKNVDLEIVVKRHPAHQPQPKVITIYDSVATDSDTVM
jgi:hypothetical protein